MHSNKRHLTQHILEQNFPNKKFKFLGAGMSSVAYTDEHKVFKVMLFEENLTYQQHYAYLLKSVMHKFEESDFFFTIEKILELENNCIIIVYDYEKSEPCKSFQTDEIQEFLIECWKKQIIFKDLKPDNFIRVKGKLKWIDYEPDNYTDNLFLNMAARAFIYIKFATHNKSYINKICRSAINNFEIKELDGFQSFMNNIFAKIIFSESEVKALSKGISTTVKQINEITSEGTYRINYDNLFNSEIVFWELIKKNIYLESVSFENINLDDENYFSPEDIILRTRKINEPQQKVSLIIKACAQDADIIFEAVKHIIQQLSFPDHFDEKILALDVRQSDFLREYNSEGSLNYLFDQSQKLVDDSVIDKFIFPKDSDILNVNQKWFGIDTKVTHTKGKVPVASQLFAFESARNDYILQVDCDAMIGRLSKEHSFLDDMIAELNQNEHVVSVGFNIYKGKEHSFTPYFGFENGGFVPEVRFCMLKKSRIERLLPLENEVFDNSFKTSWYRALENRQKESNMCSIRGGDSRSFYIHPQNFKKTDKDVWFTTIDRVENLDIPENQISEFDLAGSYYDWTLSKRNEKIVLISCFRNITLSRFLRFWYSLTSQTNQEWGLILIDDASDNGVSYFIKELIKPFKNRITFIKNRFRVGVAKNTYKAIHYFMENQESIVCILDADDALLGKNTLKNIFKKYNHFGADVVIGKMYRTDKIHPHYKYTPNFVTPRLYGGNVWQHIRSFRKYFFDSLDFNDLKITNKNLNTDDILLSKRFSQKMVFPEHCWDFTYMVPIIEMSDNPMWINNFNIFHDRTTPNTRKIKQHKEDIISEILSKPKKSSKDIVKKRKTFLPNLSQIEIDITYECNLKCINCNRSSAQAPIKGGMKLEDIENFVRESIELDKKWKLINLLGGEPSIHKDFLKIVNLILKDYIIKHSPDTILQVTSNGYGKLVHERLSKLPKHKNLIIDRDSFKDDRTVPYFSPFNDAPIDKPDSNNQEYHKGCWVTAYCGIGLNQLGYYPCGVAGGIDRVLEFNLGVKSLKEVDESIAKYLNTFCRYCGNFSDYEKNFGNFIPRNEKSLLTKPILSESWKKAYKQYNGK